MLLIITNLLHLPFYSIILLWLGLLSLIICLSFRKTIKQSSPTKDELKKSKILFRIYIDRYFVANKIKTFGLCSIYIFGNSLIFILIRYMYLGQITSLMISPVTSNIWPLIVIYLKLGITIILYKILLDVLFKNEINKLYLYVRHNRWYWHTLHNLLHFRLGEYLLGCLRVPCYRIATFTYQEKYIPGNLPEFIHGDENDYLSKNDTIIRLIKKLQELAMQYRIIKDLFVVLAYILRFFHIHIRGINEHLPYLLLFIIFSIEFYNKEFQYIYIASFIFLLIKTKRDLTLYNDKREPYTYDPILSRYFYCNDIDYKIQRMSFYHDNKIAIDSNISSYQNRALFRDHDNILDYIFRDFKNDNDPKYKRRTSGVYRRFLLTLTILCIISYLLIYKSSTYHIEGLIFVYIPLVILFIPILIMIYCGYKTYYPKNYEEDPTNADWVYSRKHNIIYWIATIIQAAILYILLIKPELSALHNDILFDTIIKITKTYTVEERIMDLFTLFEASIQNMQISLKINDQEYVKIFTELEQEYLRYYLRQQDFSNIISSTTSLKDIEKYISQLYKDYTLLKLLGDQYEITFYEYLEAVHEFVQKRKVVDTWVSFILQTALYLYLEYLNRRLSTDTTIQVISSISMKDIIKYTWLIARRLFGL